MALECDRLAQLMPTWLVAWLLVSCRGKAVVGGGATAMELQAVFAEFAFFNGWMQPASSRALDVATGPTLNNITAVIAEGVVYGDSVTSTVDTGTAGVNKWAVGVRDNTSTTNTYQLIEEFQTNSNILVGAAILAAPSSTLANSLKIMAAAPNPASAAECGVLVLYAMSYSGAVISYLWQPEVNSAPLGMGFCCSGVIAPDSEGKLITMAQGCKADSTFGVMTLDASIKISNLLDLGNSKKDSIHPPLYFKPTPGKSIVLALLGQQVDGGYPLRMHISPKTNEVAYEEPADLTWLLWLFLGILFVCGFCCFFYLIRAGIICKKCAGRSTEANSSQQQPLPPSPDITSGSTATSNTAVELSAVANSRMGGYGSAQEIGEASGRTMKSVP
eukprot:gb/GEZN01007426.1/.p1 GENE.gb/GEZN01007426.1/~~gb/GEZN01007426.1/.p1  ORF type:complete len:388 (-),score=29.80 gb/GEZN01007426.1/:309-1472(-)